jgi:hypothetical protein
VGKLRGIVTYKKSQLNAKVKIPKAEILHLTVQQQQQQQ